VALTLTDIDYTYQFGTSFAEKAVLGVSLEVARGELTLVLGATGSGKSTLLRIASGLLAPDSGSVSVDEKPMSGVVAPGAVGLVFQDAEAQLFADTVLQDVSFGPLNLGVDAPGAAARAVEALEAVGIDPESFGPRSPFTLSGGEARRVAIAGVLAMRPRYLLLDEPTAGLDAPGRALVRELIERARAEVGVVVVSHAAEEFLGTADRVLLLSSGRSAWYGSASDLVADPSPFSAAGLRAPDILRVQMAARERGAYAGEFSLDPANVARVLVESGGQG
jgi:energy-coupling factor transport system ATP-binding protein